MAIAPELAEIPCEWRDAHGHNAEYGSESFPSRGDLGKIVGALCGALDLLRLAPDFVWPHNEHVFVEHAQLGNGQSATGHELRLTHCSTGNRGLRRKRWDSLSRRLATAMLAL